jgi:hypothetical protein
MDMIRNFGAVFFGVALSLVAVSLVTQPSVTAGDKKKEPRAFT